jgi:hypothetical protein
VFIIAGFVIFRFEETLYHLPDRRLSCEKVYYNSAVNILKPGLHGAWLGTFYFITDVTDKE